MSKIFLILAVAVSLVLVGCKTHSGAREFIPGKGWVPVDD